MNPLGFFLGDDSMIAVLRDAGLSALIGPDAVLTRLAGGFEFTEGPLWLPTSELLFQDLKREATYRLAGDGTLRVLRANTGAANGQTFDAQGRIVFCEQNGRRVSRMKRDGTSVETVVEEYQGKRLNSPNDIVARSDGTLFFTDPAYGAPADRPLDFQGVYAIRPDGELVLLVDDFDKPNGLAFSPDERTLYVCDTGKYHVRAFDVEQARRPLTDARVGSGRGDVRPRGTRWTRRHEGRRRRPTLRGCCSGCVGPGRRKVRCWASCPRPAGPQTWPGVARAVIGSQSPCATKCWTCRSWSKAARRHFRTRESLPHFPDSRAHPLRLQ